MEALAPALIVLHFAYHLIAAIGVIYALWHSNSVHNRSVWKVVAAVFWLVVSVLIVFH